MIKAAEQWQSAAESLLANAHRSSFLKVHNLPAPQHVGLSAHLHPGFHLNSNIIIQKYRIIHRTDSRPGLCALV